MRLRFWRKRRPKGINVGTFVLHVDPIQNLHAQLRVLWGTVEKTQNSIDELQTRIRKQELELRELKKQINGKEKGKAK